MAGIARPSATMYFRSACLSTAPFSLANPVDASPPAASAVPDRHHQQVVGRLSLEDLAETVATQRLPRLLGARRDQLQRDPVELGELVALRARGVWNARGDVTNTRRLAVPSTTTGLLRRCGRFVWGGKRSGAVL